MSPLESIIYMIWRGVAIGVLISAPMGPVGILCIQRTLDKGRHAGFYTGVGAAISDLFYCLLTGFGLSFIEDFIERNQNIIQLVGSVVLIAFSVYLFRKDPASPLRRPVPQNVSVKKNILGGFLFTFSNPLIIFLIIGLFARFNFTAPEIKGAYYAIGYLFIVAGALGWWYGITYAIEKVRTRFNMRAMKIMNIFIGVVILIFACVGIISSISGLAESTAKAQPSKVSYINPPGNAATDTVGATDPLNIRFDASATVTLDFKLRPLLSKAGISSADKPLFSLNFSDDGRRNHETLSFEFKTIEFSPTPLSSQPALSCTASSPGGFIVTSSSPLTEKIDLPAGWCHYRVSVSPDEGVRISAGTTQLSPLLEMNNISESDSIRWSAVTISPETSKGVEIRDIRITTPLEPAAASKTLMEAHRDIRETEDPLEGIWEIFDWNMDTKKARQGGEYHLLTIKTSDGHYEMLYMDGAETCKSRWKSGMIKGRLYPTGTRYVYRLEWIDAEGRPMTNRLRAQLNPGQRLLTLSFPFLDSELRLKKINHLPD